MAPFFSLPTPPVGVSRAQSGPWEEGGWAPAQGFFDDFRILGSGKPRRTSKDPEFRGEGVAPVPAQAGRLHQETPLSSDSCPRGLGRQERFHDRICKLAPQSLGELKYACRSPSLLCD